MATPDGIIYKKPNTLDYSHVRKKTAILEKTMKLS